ncbi:MAG TPA: hypothetical protein VMY05_12470 [Acidobacteriota bacterium]|nr:hypothetical protein [Acidobacteriota bacterium]
MARRYFKGAALLLALLIFVLASACSTSDTDDPRQVVIALFGAMEKNDQAALAHLLDLAELMKSTGGDYALQGGEPRVFTNPQQILDDLTNDGETKRRWFSLQRIVNTAEVIGESATVEVTFVDKDSSRGYRTKFGLTRTNGKWRIYSFNTMR